MIDQMKEIRTAQYNVINGDLQWHLLKRKNLILELEKLQYSSRLIKKNQSKIIALTTELRRAEMLGDKDKIKNINEQLHNLQTSKIKSYLNSSKIDDLKSRIHSLDSEIDYIERLRSQYLATDYIHSNASESDLTFKECFRIINGIKRPVVLDEEDLANYNANVFLNPEKYDGLENFILVHKTNYPPINSRINSPKEVVEYDCDIKSDKIGIFKVADGRNTVHFSVNGEVQDNNGGNWDNRRYAILVPFDKVPKEQIRSYAPMDTYIEGGLKLPEGSYILCPEEEIDIIKGKNPGVNVVGFKGLNVTGYADMLVYYLGYRNQKASSNSWQDEAATKKYIDMGTSKGIFSESDASEHFYKYEKEQEGIVQNINKLKGLIKKIFDDNIMIDGSVLSHIIKNCHFDLSLKTSFKDEALKDLSNELLSFLSSYGITIPNDVLNRYIELSEVESTLTKEEIDEYARNFYSNYDNIKDINYSVDKYNYRSYLLLSTILKQVYNIQKEKNELSPDYTR